MARGYEGGLARWRKGHARALALITLALAIGMVGAEAAHAGAWAQARGKGLLITSFGAHRLDAPMGEGWLRKRESAAYLEYGLTDRLTAVGRIGWQDLEDIYDGSGEAGPGVVAVNALGGTEAGLRHQIIDRGRWAVSVQGLATFRLSGENSNNVGYGEGGGDLDGRILAGRSIGAHGFAEVQIGYRNRDSLSSHEARLDMAAGTRLSGRIRLMIQTYSVWSVGNNRDGIQRYHGHRAQAAALYDLTAQSAVSLAVLGTVDARNLADEQALLVSVWRRF